MSETEHQEPSEAAPPGKPSMQPPDLADNAAPEPKSMALLALLLLVPAASFGTLMSMVWAQGTLGQVCYGLSKLWVAVLPVVWLVAVEKRRLSWSPAKRGGFGTGIVLGLVISAIIGIGYWWLGSKLIDPETVQTAVKDNGVGTPLRYAGLAIYLITVNSLLEEYVWRWFVFRKCEALMPGWAAVLASAFCFTIHHIIALRAQFGWEVTLIGSAGVFIGGAVWSWCYLRFRSIWPGYVSHAIVDVAALAVGWHLIFGMATTG